MRTFFLFALTMAGTVALTDDASAFGKRRHHKGDACCYSGYTAPSCCGQTGVAYGNGGYGQPGVVYGSTGVYGARNTTSYYYPNGGIYPAGYNPNVYPGSGIIPAAGTIDPRTGLPTTPRTVPNPMPDRDKE